jgi:UDP-galactopyranose mutase
MEVTKSSITNTNVLNDVPLSKNPSTLICFSHLRWDFVYQRPQHLLSRFATVFNVFFVEEPHFDSHGDPTLSFNLRSENLWVVTPHLRPHTSSDEAIKIQKILLDKFLSKSDPSEYIFWYYTPMALSFSGHYQPALVLYDCMDELSNFKFAPPELRQLEHDLLQKADIVFTGGHSLFEAKKHLHKNIFPFPSSIDKKHFEQARTIENEPADQQHIGFPRLGFYGVIDERFDIELITNMALQRPDWNFILLGPVVKIDAETLPKLHNIFFLGGKSYNELPAYLSKWDIALIPFMLNDATRYISPTKTPEYLAAGVPVVSTPIRDVVYPYGEEGFVKIASDAQGFVAAAEELMKMDKQTWIPEVDKYLSTQSWSLTFTDMMKNINSTLIKKTTLN